MLPQKQTKECSQVRGYPYKRSDLVALMIA
jgi:hypothetical protein